MGMTTHRNEYLELCAGYVLGSLEPSERATLEAHLAAGCPECEAELARLSAGAFVLAASAPSHRAPAHLKARVLSAVRAEARRGDAPESRPAPAPIPLPRARRGAPPLWRWAIAAAVLLALIGVTWQVVGTLERNLAAARSQMAELRKQLDEEKSWMALLESPQSRVVELHATPQGSAELAARVIFDPVSRRALVVCDRFTAPAGQDYQLWAIAGGGPASLGLVRADAAGHAVIRLTDVGDPRSLGAFAVSLEREGGSPTPTAPAGPVVMLGKLGG
jgi:anti-sigma-K factor RskA